MAVNNRNTIVTNGLILYLDAANQRSYVSGSNTWYDLSGNGNNFTLTNNPSINNNGLYFNGSSQYAYCVNNTFGSYGTGSFTIEYFMNIVGVNNAYAPLLIKRNGDVSIGQTGLNGWVDRIGANTSFIQDSSPGNSQANALQLSYTYPIGINCHLTSVYSRTNSGLTNNAIIYINGQSIITGSKVFTGDGSVSNSYNTYLMYNPQQTGYCNGTMFVVKSYNRDLSTQEVLQNYNALKSRFNLS